MISLDRTLPCPVCKTPIPFDLQLLLKGEVFVCPNCNVRISLPEHSSATVQSALNKLHEIEQNKKE